MKISIITMHRIVNYGSVLQAYATQYIFEKMGCETEIIDYQTKRMTMTGMIRDIKEKNDLLKKSLLIRTAVRIIMIPSYLKRFPVFKRFVSNNLKISKHLYTCEEDFEKYPLETDLLVTGSDQVWNSDVSNGIDRPFYFSFDDTKEKIAFSASFGKSKLKDEEKKEIHLLLSKYKAISVREKSGIEILENLGLKGQWILDPTLLLTKEEWAPFISERYSNKKYILVYNINREKGLDKFVRRLEKAKKIPVYFLSYQWHDFYKHGKLKCCPAVEDFLGLIKSAEYVVTDSFHCLAFSIVFNKQVMPYYPHKFSTRLASLVELIGLQKQVITENATVEIADNKIEWDKISKRLANEKKNTLKWLENAIISSIEK
ncbi:polysaccharide pyruvyl transferase family protein [Thomasclavelia sp.]|uniref:polysaccharide pyruvyl transferase family protein n=1 Tax=Thomasclavelia sp. TaxID=3025757 RepID=UPI0025FEEE3D|nr:polysaccharide pyruvyl transferase family protein [Thomasclavelia sp.]